MLGVLVTRLTMVGAAHLFDIPAIRFCCCYSALVRLLPATLQAAVVGATLRTRDRKCVAIAPHLLRIYKAAVAMEQ